MSRYYKRAQNIGWFVIEVDTTIAGTTGVGNFEFRTLGTRNYNIVWGDGAMDRNVTANITHNYPSAGIYKVAVVGVLPRVAYNGMGDRLKVKKILSFGDIVWDSFFVAFQVCAINQINGPIINGKNVTNFQLAFSRNEIPSIPEGFLDNCPNAAIFTQAFEFNLISNISGNLFTNNPLATAFNSCFRDNLLITIPAGLFQNNTLVTNFAATFFNNQINTIPQGLFDNCPLVTSFNTCFANNGLIPNCPSDLFANNPLANNFTNCFLSSTLPTATYSDMLVNLDANNANTNVPFHGGNSTYTGAAAIAARANLVNVKGWTITDGGQV
jgi:hypothetical protein